MYKIEKNERIANGIYRLVLCAPEIAERAKAGQFVNVYLPGGDMLLPRPFGIADACKNFIEVVYAAVGKGTERLSAMTTGESLRALGPNGNGFDLHRAGRNVILIGGGLGIAPLRFAAKQLRERGAVKVTALLGYSGAVFYAREMQNALSSNSLYTISETENDVSGELGITGNVMDLAAELMRNDKLDLRNSCVFACGPAPMLKAVSDWAGARDIPAQLSLEARMGCGYGACVGCSVKLRDAKTDAVTQKKVCADGPVFEASEVIWS